MIRGSTALLALMALVPALAKQCCQFDTSGNLYVFGGDQDYNLGQNTSWASPSPVALTSSGRPPWTGNNTACSLSQYSNALYVLDADAANPGDIYIYDFGASSWSKQSTTSSPNLSTGSSVLDHDTNVFFAMPAASDAGSIFSLDLGTVTTQATGSAIAWEEVGTPNFSMGGRQVVMSQASNHIVFFNVPDVPAGSARMFVVHYSYFQPEIQPFQLASGATTNFPSTHGQALPIPLANNDAGKQVVFIPDDYSHTYVLTHWTNPSDWSITTDAPAGIESLINSTQTLPPPMAQDAGSTYASSDTTLVQFASNGDLYYLPSAFGNGWSVSQSATWQKLDYKVAGLTGSASTTASTSQSAGSSSTSSSSGGSASAASTGSPTTTGSTSSQTTASNSNNSQGRNEAKWMSGLSGTFACIALFVSF